jgi:hypothetical protein
MKVIVRRKHWWDYPRFLDALDLWDDYNERKQIMEDNGYCKPNCRLGMTAFSRSMALDIYPEQHFTDMDALMVIGKQLTDQNSLTLLIRGRRGALAVDLLLNLLIHLTRYLHGGLQHTNALYQLVVNLFHMASQCLCLVSRLMVTVLLLKRLRRD